MKKITLMALMTIISAFSFSQELPKIVQNLVDTNSTITSIAQDENSFWIGTNHGLMWVSKENNKFILLTTKNSQIPCDQVTSVCCRKNGNVWIGTTMGIMRYDNYAFLQITSDNSMLPDEFITSIIEDTNNNLWIGTRYGGLVKASNNKFYVYNNKNSLLTSNYVLSLSKDEKGNIIVKTDEQGDLSASYVATKN